MDDGNESDFFVGCFNIFNNFPHLDICKEKVNAYMKCIIMPSILVPSSYKILEKNRNGWVEVSKLANGFAECWTGQTFCRVSLRKTVEEDTSLFLLLDSVTLLAAGDKTETINVCYKWQPPPVVEKFTNPACFIRDHEILALKDFATRKKDKRNQREYFTVPQDRFATFTHLKNIPNRLRGKSVVIYEDDLPDVENACERGIETDGQLHLRHYMEIALALKGNRRQQTKNKADHTEMFASYIPISSWRRLRRAVSLCGVTNSYSFKVREICPFTGKKRRRVRLRFVNDEETCMTVKGKLAQTYTIQAVRYKEEKLPVTWIEIEWNEEESKTIIIEAIQIWAANSTHINSSSNKVDEGVLSWT